MEKDLKAIAAALDVTYKRYGKIDPSVGYLLILAQSAVQYAETQAWHINFQKSIKKIG